MNNDTHTSPGIGLLPAHSTPFSDYGGMIVDMLGVNGKRFTAQVNLSSTQPVYISGIFAQVASLSGLSSVAVRLGGIAQCNIRLTIQDGNSASPNPIYAQVFRSADGATPGDVMPYSGQNILDPLHLAPDYPTNGHSPSFQPIGYDARGGKYLYLGVKKADGALINCGYLGNTKTFLLDSAGATDHYWSGGLTDRSFTGFPGISAIWTPMLPAGSRGVAYYNSVISRINALPPDYQVQAQYGGFAVTGWFSVPSADLISLGAALTALGQMQIGLVYQYPALGYDYASFARGLSGAGTIYDIPLIPATVDSFTANPATVVGVQDVTLTWTTTNCTSVSIDHGVGTCALPTSGSVVIPGVSAATTFMLTGTGDRVDTASVNVAWQRPAALINAFTAAPNPLTAPGHTTLSWNVSNADTVVITNASGWDSGPLGASGSIAGSEETILGDVVFTLTAGQTGVATPVTASITVPLVAPTLVITTPNPLPALDFRTGVCTPFTFTGSGGFGGYTWSATGVPAGLTLSAAGVFSGTLTGSPALQTFSLVVTLSGTGMPSVHQTFLLPFLAPALAIVSTVVPTADPINPYSFQFVGSGGFGDGTYTWSATGLPSWLSLSAGGLLHGTPPPGQVPHTYPIVVTLSGSGMTVPAVANFSLAVVYLPLAISTTQADLDASPARALVPYEFQFQTAPAGATWSIPVADQWAALIALGLMLGPTGLLQGTPRTYGYWNFTVQASAPGCAPVTMLFQLMVQLGWSQIDPLHDIFYRVKTQEGTPFLVNGTQLCNDPAPELGGDVFAQVVVAFEVGTNDFIVTDARTCGGGLAPEFQTIEEARNFFDVGYWDGKPYPIGGGLVIQLPISLLDRMSREEVVAKLDAILPLGTLPVVRYYDPTGEETV